MFFFDMAASPQEKAYQREKAGLKPGLYKTQA
jgi:hypothetical protein